MTIWYSCVNQHVLESVPNVPIHHIRGSKIPTDIYRESARVPTYIANI